MNISQNRFEKYKHKNNTLNNQTSGTNIEFDEKYIVKILSSAQLKNDKILNAKVMNLQKECFGLGCVSRNILEKEDEDIDFLRLRIHNPNPDVHPDVHTDVHTDMHPDVDFWILVLSNDHSLCIPIGSVIATLMFRKTDLCVYNVCTKYECRGKQYNAEKSYVSCLFDILKRNLSVIYDGAMLPHQIYLEIERVVNFPYCEDPTIKLNIIRSYFNNEITPEEYDHIYANTRRINPQFCKLVKVYEKQGFMFDSETYLYTKFAYNI